MIFDAISYQEYLRRQPKSSKNEAILSFLNFLERKLGAVAMYPLSGVPLRNLELVEPFAIAQSLVQHGILRSFERNQGFPDEPRYHIWNCINEDILKSVTSGMSLNDTDALYAAAAEGLERYLWIMEWDYFDTPVRASAASMKERGEAFIAPERFAGCRERDQAADKKKDDAYTWIRGESLVSGSSVYIPAQTVSGAHFPGYLREKSIRERSTNGLATWPTKTGARLSGMLEIVERDAFAITWLNQLTPPKIDLASLSSQHPAIARMKERCRRYQLNVHALRLPTDAPTHAICVVVEDTTGVRPRFAFGLKAHASLAVSVEKALFEALRARLSYRWAAPKNLEAEATIPMEKIGHKDRMYWWNVGDRSRGLEFLTEGDERAEERYSWENDSPEEHLARLVAWCREKSYECVAVSVGDSKRNPTTWHVESVTMPDLQPLHLDEKERVLTGRRLSEVPRAAGFTPRAEPFTAAPHPFY